MCVTEPVLYAVTVLYAVGLRLCCTQEARITCLLTGGSAMSFEFTSPFDNNGLLYHLGTTAVWHGNLGTDTTVAYVNPHKRGLVVASMSSILMGSPDLFVEQRPKPGVRAQYNGTMNKLGAWMAVDLGSTRKFSPTWYCLRNGDDVGYSALRNLVLQASQDGHDWVSIKVHNDDHSLAERKFSEAAWAVEAQPDKAWRHFRILQTGPSSGGSHGDRALFCSGIELYGELRKLR